MSAVGGSVDALLLCAVRFQEVLLVCGDVRRPQSLTPALISHRLHDLIVG